MRNLGRNKFRNTTWKSKLCSLIILLNVKDKVLAESQHCENQIRHAVLYNNTKFEREIIIAKNIVI